MHDNRNKEVLRRVEKGMMRANRIRNIFAVLAVALTTFMITSVFSLGINYQENMKLMEVRAVGSGADVSLALPTPEQEKEIRSLDYVDTIGIQYRIGDVIGKNEAGRELAIAMQCYDETEWEEHYKEAISNINGSYPANEKEIMLSEDALLQLGIREPRSAMEIPLTYQGKDGEQKETFILSGWFRSYTGNGMAFLSESYCKENGYTLQNSGALSLSLKDPGNDFLRIQNDIPLNEGQSFQGAVAMKSSSGSLYVMMVLLVLFIIGSGYLLIYNVLYISISRDTRFYGLIKTLGTTEKQIRSLVKRQAVTFGCIGIPVGMVLAAAVSFGLIPYILKEAFDSGKSVMDAVMFFHPGIFLLSVIFSALTVWVACNAPAKVAGRISPVEALRYQNFAAQKAKSRNSTNGGKLPVMAYHNVFRDKKRAILVFCSLFMGTVTILGVNGVLGSMSGENYVKKYVDYDFQYTDVQFQQAELTEKEVPQFDGRFVEQISGIPGVGDIEVRKSIWAEIRFDEQLFEQFMELAYADGYYSSQGKSYEQMVEELKAFSEAGEYGCYVSTLDESYIEKYNTICYDTPVDLEAFRRGDIILLGTDTEYYAPNRTLVGKTLNLKADSEGSQELDFVVGGALCYRDYEEFGKRFNIGRRKFIGVVPDVIYVSEAGMKKLTETPYIYQIGVDVEDDSQLQTVHRKLLALNETLTKKEWEYKSVVSELEKFNQTNYSMNLIGNGAAVLLIMTGLINFVNVMLTSVIARKNEFAVMESIGTSKRQIGKMLVLEGGVYALVSTLLIMTLGNVFLMLVADAVPHLADYAKFEYPVALVICLILIIFVICLSVPAVVYRLISKETVIERLHDLGD